MITLTKKQIQERLAITGIKKIGRPYTQRDIADIAKVSYPHVSQVLNGDATSQPVMNIVSLLLGESIKVERNKQRRKVNLII